MGNNFLGSSEYIRHGYLELLGQLGGELVAGELFPDHLVVLHQLLAVVCAPLQAILI